jgi:cyclophilin family peptidyl-prolyl cis-trans isomerase
MMWAATHESNEELHEQEVAQRKADAKIATKEPGRTAVVQTSKGVIKFVLWDKDVPNTCNHFVELAQQKFYDGSTWHRVIKDFVIQGGKPKDPNKRASKIKLELKDGLAHELGAVGMARAEDPDSADSEFYITTASRHELDGKYCVFGLVTEGLDVAKKIKMGDEIKSIRIVDTFPQAKAKIKADNKAKDDAAKKAAAQPAAVETKPDGNHQPK